MVAPMASTPKEKEKCLEKGDKEEVPTEAETPQNSEKMTCKKFIKFLFGCYVMIALLGSCWAIFSTARDVLAKKSDCATKQYAGVILAVTTFSTLIYCYWRNACKALLTEIATEFAVIFSPYLKWREAIAQTNIVMSQYSILLLIAPMLKWCLVTLIYGPEISMAFLKSQTELSNSTCNVTMWIENQKLAREFFQTCLGFWPTMLLLITIIICGILFKAAETTSTKQSTQLLTLVKRVCGSNLMEFYMHWMCFQILTENVGIFVVLAGWITKDCIESCTVFSSFFLVMIPTYIVYFLACALLELMVYCMHIGRVESIEEKLDPVQPLSPSVA